MSAHPRTPRRRGRTALLLALLVVLLAGAYLLVPRQEPAPPDAADQARPGPVLIVPGYGGATRSLEALAEKLNAAGMVAKVVPAVGDGTGSLEESAAALGAAVDQELAAGAPSVDVVGYSAGGVIARTWVEREGASKARRVVTLGSPHHGTAIAAFAAGFAPQECPVACQQLVPDSDLLRELNEGDETPGGPEWTSVWTTLDETVTPASTAELEGAVNVQVQEVCPDAKTTHGGLPRDPLVVGIVISALTEPEFDGVDASACGPLRALGS